MNFAFINPGLDRIVKVVDEVNATEAVISFKSSVWKQGYDSEGQMRQYDSWAVYSCSENSDNALTYLGQVKDYDNQVKRAKTLTHREGEGDS